MKLEIAMHEAPAPTDTAVYAPYSWGGNALNATERYDMIAEHTGFDVIGAHSAGTGRVIIDQATRKSLHAESLDELALQHAEVLSEEVFDRYEKVVGLGDSGRGIWVASMQLSDVQPFTHVLVRDGVNLYAPEPIHSGAYRLLRAWRQAYEIGEASAPIHSQAFGDIMHTMACAASEAWTHRQLMCGTASKVALEGLALQQTTPFHNVALGNGIGGTPQDVQAFNDTLLRLREQHVGTSVPPLFEGSYEENWGHGNLLNPAGAAKHIRQTIALDDTNV